MVDYLGSIISFIEKKRTHVEDIWEPVEEIVYLQPLLKKYHAESPENPTTISSPVDKIASPPLIAARSGAKVAPLTSTLIRFPAYNPSFVRNPLSVRVLSIPIPNCHLPIRVHRSLQ